MANTVIAHVACGPVQGSNLGGALLGSDWLLLSVLALVISTLALTLVYMFANFMRNAQLIGWSKFELFQVFGTAVILVFFIFSLWGMCTFDMSFLDKRFSPQDNMYKIIDEYFSKLQDVGYLIFYMIMWVTKWLTFLSRVQITSSPLGVGSNENPLESMSQLNSLVFIMLSGFITSFLLLQLQMRMLDYLAFACIGYLFPMGIFLRCFEPTRSFGGTLLGLSIALFLFYPIIMVFNDYLMYSSIDDLATEQRLALQSAENNAASGSQPNGQQVSDQAGTILDPQNGGKGYNSFSGGITGGVLFLLKPIMVYFIAAVVLPVINFIVLVEITRGATAFLGDEIDVSNLTRLI